MENKTLDTAHTCQDNPDGATTPESDNSQPSQIKAKQAEVVKSPLPKRLAALCAFFTIASISGIYAQQGELFCILTLIMVIAILGRQRTAMFFLQGYTVLQLALVSILPVFLYDPDNLLVGNPSTFQLGDIQAKVPDFIIFGLLIVLAMLQVWVAFTPKVKAYFKTKINMNIMS